MRARMPHLQLWKGKWRVRKPIPISVQAVIGRGQYLTRGLGTANRAEADRLAISVLAEFQDIIERARRGDSMPKGLKLLPISGRAGRPSTTLIIFRESTGSLSLRAKANSRHRSRHTSRKIGHPLSPGQRASKP